MENQASKPLDPEESRALLLERAREASSSSGVYLMRDDQGAVLYVGKAKNLRNRLQTYFQSGPHKMPRTEMLVLRVHHFDVILTETETEALILECSLIKKHKPKFNVRLKDDKAYPYLKIRREDPFPRLEWTRKVQKDGARYFGPFPSAWAAREVMGLLNEAFRLRDCSENAFHHRSRPCILYQMQKCSGPCVGLIAAEDYRESMDQVIEVLEGKSDRMVRSLRKGMEDAAQREEFEAAAKMRDQLRSLEVVTATQGVDEAGSGRDRDVVGLVRHADHTYKNAEAHAVILQIRGGVMLAVRHYSLQNTDPSLPDSELLFDFLAQFYVMTDQLPGLESEISRPREVLLPVAPDDPDLLERTLGMGIRVAENEVDTRILNVAKTNAQYAFEQATKRLAGHGVQVLEEVQDKLHLQRFPHRIECYDISNTQGEDAVASRVVFVEGAPDKNLYRRYKIRTVEGANDFAMMKEVLSRRFSGSSQETLPDLVVVDGGKGQLAQAVAVLEELGLQGVGVVGLAKARVESDFQAKEVKSSHERVFIPNRKNPVALLPHTDAYKLLTHVRDEAHRFAITYHRLLRKKRSMGEG